MTNSEGRIAMRLASIALLGFVTCLPAGRFGLRH
jgi:hypothetical protein